MRDCPLVRQTLGEVLHKLRPADRFRVACVDVAARPLDDGWQKAGGPEVEKALERFDREFCLGGTDFDVILAEATALFDEKSPRRRLVVYLGDGGQTDAGDKLDVLIGRLAHRLQDAHSPLVAVLARGSDEGADADGLRSPGRAAGWCSTWSARRSPSGTSTPGSRRGCPARNKSSRLKSKAPSRTTCTTRPPGFPIGRSTSSVASARGRNCGSR